MDEVEGEGGTKLTYRHKKRCFCLFCFYRKYNYAGSTLFLSMRWEGEVGGGQGGGAGQLPCPSRELKFLWDY